MTRFSIALSEAQFESGGEMVSQGSLRIGEFAEDFHASLSYWDRESYVTQWKEALERLLRGESRSAIVTSMYDPKNANFIFWWVMYRIGDNVHIQNHCLFLGELAEPFDESDIYDAIPQRETVSEDGQAISEWVVKLSDIAKYLIPQN